MKITLDKYEMEEIIAAHINAQLSGSGLQTDTNATSINHYTDGTMKAISRVYKKPKKHKS
jgi:hypothetical protein